jgi:hypothetical protein
VLAVAEVLAIMIAMVMLDLVVAVEVLTWRASL